jgi:flagellar FliJ protein
MKKYTFRLEKILQLRKFREEECKLALGQAVSMLNKIENEIKLTAVKRHNAVAQRFSNINEITSWNYYIIRLDQEAEKLARQLAQVQLVVEGKRALYLEALKGVKVIEKLKEKRWKEYRKEIFNYQMAEVDDLTAARMIGMQQQ